MADKRVIRNNDLTRFPETWLMSLVEGASQYKAWEAVADQRLQMGLAPGILGPGN